MTQLSADGRADSTPGQTEIQPSLTQGRLANWVAAFRTWWIGLALLTLIVVNVLGNLYWIDRNLVLIGHDSSSYLDTTIEYTKFFTNISLQTLFKAFTYTDYRSPGLFVAVQPFYWLFGVNMDSAQLVNVLLMAILVVITFALGRHVAGSSESAAATGLFAALLVGLLPMVTAMARLFYTEIGLTVAVVLNLLALSQSEGFRHRGWSILWGLSLGFGMLVKWAMPIYILLPLVWAIWKADLLGQHVAGWRSWRIHYRALAIAVAIGLMAAALWGWPNRGELQRFLLGNWLYVGWFVVAGLLAYALQLPPTPVSNWWAGVFAAVTVASVWYLPYVDFVAKLVGEDQARGDMGATPLHVYNYVRYFRWLYSFHFGALAFWVIVPAAFAPWLMALWRRRSISARSTVLWLSLLSTYVVLALLAQSSPRFLVPVLPVIAVLAALGLWQYPRPLRLVLGTLWVVALGLQWSIFTFGALDDLYARTQALWVARVYSIQPSSYETDPGYWIGPAVLDRIDAGGSEVQRLGVLINTNQLHRGTLGYLLDLDPRPIQIKALTEGDSPGWFDLLSSRWVLLKDGDNRDVDPPGQALLQRIFAGDPLFHTLYREAARYPLPNGETAYLYHRANGPGRPHDLPLQLEQTRPVADAIRKAWSDHASLVYADANLAVWVGIHDPAAESVVVLDDEQESGAYLSGLQDTLLVVWNHESDHLQAWMNEHAYRANEVGDDFASVAIYGRPREPLQSIEAEAAWPYVALSALRTYPTVAPGQVLPIETQFEGAADGQMNILVRLEDSAGSTIAVHDRPLVSQDRFGLFVPPATLPGEYRLLAVIYDPANLAVAADRAGASSTLLATIVVANY